MAFCAQSPFAQVAASPLAAAFPGAASTCVAANENGSTAPTGSFFVCDATISASCTPAQHDRLPKRALTSIPQRAGSFCLAGSFTECRTAKAQGRVSCGADCCGTACNAELMGPDTLHLQQQHLPMHMSLPAFRDLDALLAAAACKPGYRPSTDLDSHVSAAVACAGDSCSVAPAPAVCSVLEQYGVRHVADGAAAGIADAALGLISENGLADTFYVYDLGEVRGG